MRASDDRLEERIDAGLRSYAEPPAIPDTRVAIAGVLERAREAGSRAGRRWFGWISALAAAALAATLFAVWWLPPGPKAPRIAWIPKAPGVAADPEVRLVQEQPPRIRPHARSLRPTVAAVQPLPKLEIFPTPAPLSPQERALVAFAEQAPLAVQRAVVRDQKRWAGSIIVAGLQPHPLPAANLQDR